jgi:hypothetical protein
MLESDWLRCHMKIRVTWTAPTHPRKKFTAASLKLCRVSIGAGGSGIRLDIQDVTGLDDQAPASPDGTSTHQSSVLGEGELLGGTGEVGDTSDDQAPLS